MHNYRLGSWKTRARRLAGRWPCPGAWSFPFHPDAEAHSHPAIWSAVDAAAVIVLDQAPEGFGGIDPAVLLADHEVLVDWTDRAGRHLVICGRSGRHRLLVKNPASRRGHVFVVIPDARHDARIAALAALHGWRNARFTQESPGARRPTDYQCHKLNLMLMILDHLGGAADRSITIRELAETVLFPGGGFGRSIEWKTSSLRRQTQRLAREAIDMANGGYRKLLNGQMRGTDRDVR